ncbi:MAG: TonB-dependent receptor [Proteobacteria bacterium]|jgi:hypothetical protein|nr:TonB-dependent receptor [Pseudomonadota bacterium]
MSVSLRGCILCMLTTIFTDNALAQNTDIEALRVEVAELRQDYESRIAELEQRLEMAERSSSAALGAAPAPGGRNTSANSAFNPAIGIIFQGQAWNYDNDPKNHIVQGFPFGGEAGPFDEGLATGEAEINISANVDDKFTAWLTVPVVIEDGEAGVEIEEAWIETTALPGGFSSRFGRFFSGIAYLNNKHAHSWDFADQPLPYQAFLGDQYLDDGVQLRWIAPTDLYIELGAEVFRGSRFPAAGAERSGYGSNSLFANIGGDFARDHSWLAGISHLKARSFERPSGANDAPILFSGNTDTTIAQFVWKWAPNGNWKQRNLVFQTGLFWNTDQGEYTLPGGPVLTTDNDQRGWYAQTVYQPFPRWRVGARVDGLSKDSIGNGFSDSVLAAPADDLRRYSLMADWSNSEFSRLRFQYTRDEAGPGNDNQWGLQYIFSIGAHGAHSF